MSRSTARPLTGHPDILAALNALLAGELAARDQYFIHGRMLAEWGYQRTADRILHEMEDETQHAGSLIQRILMLGGVPQMVPAALTIGHDVPSMFRLDLAVEYRVIEHLREVMALCEQHRDFVTRELLLVLLDDTERDHAHWLEQQLRLIDQVGLPNYLQAQAA